MLYIFVNRYNRVLIMYGGFVKQKMLIEFQDMLKESKNKEINITDYLDLMRSKYK